LKFGWETKKEKILRGFGISAEKKLEGIRLINELADRVLTKRQKIMRQKIRNCNGH
jgi:hypothetical protein